MFEQSGPHYCPVCPPVFVGKNKNRRGNPPLTLEVRNYSGCSVDFASCSDCKKRFQLSYIVAAKYEEIK
jgi:hypothetical protein